MVEPEARESLGVYLRGLREARSASLQEMARSTRVSVSHLEALEAESLADLPAPVFVKGFIRAYCHFLGEGANEALARYRDMVSQRPAAEPRPARRAPTVPPSPVLVSLALVTVLGVSLLAFNFLVKRAPERAVEPVAAAVQSDAAIAPASPASGAGSGGTQRLIVRAVDATWIRIQTDDGRVTEELLQPGAAREWTSERRFLLTVGNAGGIELELNGKPLPSLGARGAVIHRLELPQSGPALGS